MMVNIIKKILLYAGIASPLVYTATVIVGGALWPDYDPISQAVSELTGAGAPNQNILAPMFSCYNWLLLIFGFGLFIYFRGRAPKTALTASILVIASQLLSLSWVFFPMDVPGTSATFQGSMHLAVAGLVAPITIAIPLLFGLGFKRMPSFRSFSTLSLVFSGIIFIAGLTSALSIAFFPQYMGIFERITIFGYQIFIFLLALKTLRSNSAIHQ